MKKCVDKWQKKTKTSSVNKPQQQLNPLSVFRAFAEMTREEAATLFAKK